MHLHQIKKTSCYFYDDEEGNHYVQLYLQLDSKATIKTKTMITRENAKSVLAPVKSLEIEEDISSSMVPIEYAFDTLKFNR